MSDDNSLPIVPAVFDEIHRLVAAQVRSSLAPDEHARLELLLSESAANRSLYLDYISDTVSLCRSSVLILPSATSCIATSNSSCR